jgi:hypothetical protein
MVDETAGQGWAIGGIDSSVPHSARIWNYWLGGKDNYPVDREAGDRYRALAPGIVEMARSSRVFLARTVRFLAGEQGIRQFLDIGTGLPTVDNTHEVAQRVNPRARIVYVDNDPLVLTHARALLTSTPQGVTDYIEADLRNPEHILDAAAETLDYTEPVALMLMGVLGHVADYDEAKAIVRRLLDRLPTGSYLVHRDAVNANPRLAEAQRGYDATGAVRYVLRDLEQFAGYYEGLELVEPGLVSCPLWRPESADARPTDLYGAVARKV